MLDFDFVKIFRPKPSILGPLLLFLSEKLFLSDGDETGGVSRVGRCRCRRATVWRYLVWFSS